MNSFCDHDEKEFPSQNLPYEQSSQDTGHQHQRSVLWAELLNATEKAPNSFELTHQTAVKSKLQEPKSSRLHKKQLLCPDEAKLILIIV